MVNKDCQASSLSDLRQKSAKHRISVGAIHVAEGFPQGTLVST
ncbi:hypothetical protein [Nostoc sp.]